MQFFAPYYVLPLHQMIFPFISRQEGIATCTCAQHGSGQSVTLHIIASQACRKKKNPLSQLLIITTSISNTAGKNGALTSELIMARVFSFFFSNMRLLIAFATLALSLPPPPPPPSSPPPLHLRRWVTQQPVLGEPWRVLSFCHLYDKLPRQWTWRAGTLIQLRLLTLGVRLRASDGLQEKRPPKPPPPPPPPTSPTQGDAEWVQDNSKHTVKQNER